MTEEEYLDLKKFLSDSILLADEMRKKSPQNNRIYIHNFSTVEELKLTDSEVEKWDEDLDVIRQLSVLELDISFAAELIWTYEVGRGIK